MNFTINNLTVVLKLDLKEFYNGTVRPLNYSRYNHGFWEIVTEQITIKAKTEPGEIITVPNKGHRFPLTKSKDNEGSGSGSSETYGDLFVYLDVAPHPLYQLERCNIIHTIQLSIEEAQNEIEYVIEYLDKQAIVVKLSKLTNSSYEIIYPQLGFYNSKDDYYGHFIIKFNVNFIKPIRIPYNENDYCKLFEPVQVEATVWNSFISDDSLFGDDQCSVSSRLSSESDSESEEVNLNLRATYEEFKGDCSSDETESNSTPENQNKEEEVSGDRDRDRDRDSIDDYGSWNSLTTSDDDVNSELSLSLEVTYFEMSHVEVPKENFNLSARTVDILDELFTMPLAVCRDNDNVLEPDHELNKLNQCNVSEDEPDQIDLSKDDIIKCDDINAMCNENCNTNNVSKCNIM